MNLYRVKMTVFFAFLLINAVVNAQKTMIVKEKSGTITSFTLNNIDKITFPTGNVKVQCINSTFNTFILNNVQHLNFSIPTGITDLMNSELKLNLFPNPANNQISLQYNASKSEYTTIFIFDIQGKLVYKKIVKSNQGSNTEIIPVDNLQTGLFYCRLQSGSEIVCSKFIKN